MAKCETHGPGRYTKEGHLHREISMQRQQRKDSSLRAVCKAPEKKSKTLMSEDQVVKSRQEKPNKRGSVKVRTGSDKNVIPRACREPSTCGQFLLLGKSSVRGK